MNRKTILPLLAILLVGTEELAASTQHTLADPAIMIRSAKRVDFVGENTFAAERSPFGLVLRSTPDHSASGLYFSVSVPPVALAPVTWHWRVDRLQRSADMRNLKTEDSGATIFFIFGEPSLFNKDVPTLAYIWSGTPVPDETVLPSRRYQSLNYIQVRGAAEVGHWQQEHRDLAADYRKIFGTAPPPLRYVAIFNDNDQTGETTSAEFGAIDWDR
jgi:hypothetical protein